VALEGHQDGVSLLLFHFDLTPVATAAYLPRAAHRHLGHSCSRPPRPSGGENGSARRGAGGRGTGREVSGLSVRRVHHRTPRQHGLGSPLSLLLTTILLLRHRCHRHQKFLTRTGEHTAAMWVGRGVILLHLVHGTQGFPRRAAAAEHLRIHWPKRHLSFAPPASRRPASSVRGRWRTLTKLRPIVKPCWVELAFEHFVETARRDFGEGRGTVPPAALLGGAGDRRGVLWRNGAGRC